MLPLALLAGLLGAGSAQAVTVSKPGIDATVTAAVAPTRLPAHGAAPVTLALDGAFTRTDLSGPDPLRGISLLLDRQLTFDTTGLPICKIVDIRGAPPAYARNRCGSALIGSGTADASFRYPEYPEPFNVHSTVLFFNGRRGMLMYASIPRSAQPDTSTITTITGSGRRLNFPIRFAGYAFSFEFTFTFGKTWHYRGERHGYLSGSCASGTLRNTITVELDSGPVSEAGSQRCTKRGG